MLIKQIHFIENLTQFFFFQAQNIVVFNITARISNLIQIYTENKQTPEDDENAPVQYMKNKTIKIE